MPFKEFDIDKYVNDRREADSEFKVAWDNSRTEYRILGELIKLRKEKGITQGELAEKTGHKQQVISRMENKESSPTLKTFCALADELGVDIRLVPKHIG